MRLALAADIHANIQALAAVLDDIARHDCDEIWVLGDLVGYGGDPAACVELLRECGVRAVIGNHDRAVVTGALAQGTNRAARAGIEHARTQLSAAALSWIASLPARHEDGPCVAVHGCFLNDDHTWGYVTATMLEANLRRIPGRIGMVGHTHFPLAGWLQGESALHDEMAAPLTWPADAQAVLVNPGSVGQPRDGDTRASWGLLDVEARHMEVHRVPYDVEAAAAAVRRAGLPESLAQRLLSGH